MKKKIIAGVLSALLLTTSISAFSEGVENFNWNNTPQLFSDVPSTQWYYEAVSKTSASGIINGIGNNQFNPKGTLTHAEAMTLMAKVHAIYLYGNSDIINEYQKIDSHWASGIHSYCLDHRLPTPSVSDFDTNISRGTMARYFRNSLPSKAFEEINDLSLAPEETTNTVVQDLFKAGILIGDHSGFRLDDSITRAEAAAIIHRVANPNVRVRVEAPEQTQSTTPATPVTPQQPGQVQTAKPYKNIPNTNWQSDPTGGVTITSQSGAINTKYGNHTYGCNNQQEYDKVMSVMDEAYNYAIQKEANKSYRFGLDSYAKEGDDKVVFYQQQLGITNKQQIISMRVTENFVYEMRQYLFNTYAKPNGVGTNTDSGNNNVYKYLFEGGHLDCDGNGYFNMLCYDYLGFSTRMITSYSIKHAASQVYVNGHWVMLEQGSGTFADMCTHDQLLELMSGVKNDAYAEWDSDADAIIITASSSPNNLSDLQILGGETPTHNPSDTSVR